jgi:hypothetical protein
MKKKVNLFIWLGIILLLLLVVLFLLLDEAYAQPVKLNLSISPIDGSNLSKLSLSVESKKKINDVLGEIILPEGFELVEGNLRWEADLRPNEPKEFGAIVEPVQEGEWDIQAFAEGHSAIHLKTEIDPSLNVSLGKKIDPSQITEYEETWKDWLEKKERDMQEHPEKYYRACFEASGCKVPASLKGKELNDYFKSLSLSDDPMYVLVQFDVLGADPSWIQVNFLRLQGLELFGDTIRGGAHTYVAKASKNFLENKHYDFIRWMGVKESEVKLPEGLMKRVSNCTGNIEVNVFFYEKFENLDDFEAKRNQVLDLSEKLIGQGEDMLSITIDVRNLSEIASLNFVEKLEIVSRPCITGGLDIRSLPCNLREFGL